jgi:16S rRNA (cytidine1402-2'-O)-methyltransferase
MVSSIARKKGCLYLLPSLLGDVNPTTVIPQDVIDKMNQIRYFIVENARTSRRFLSKTGIETPIGDLHFFELNKHTNPADVHAFLAPALEGNDVGLLSEAGTPCIADPGAVVVEMAHAHGIKVVPLIGPNSIILALMASGLNGQYFAFNGYLPIQAAERSRAIKQIEMLALETGQSQVFIETPFRNNQLLQALVKICKPSTRLCIAVDITLGSELIATRTIGEWGRQMPELNKRPAVFIIGM